MDFLKKHYEKVLLGLVLIGLAIGAAFLPIMISGERDQLDRKRDEILSRKVEPLKPLDLAPQNDLLKRAETPLHLDFSTTNKLFNSFPWLKTADGRIIKVQESNIGPKAVTITDISPLFTIITLDSVQASDSGPRYVIVVERQASSNPALRRKKTYYAVLNAKNEAFILREVKGPPEDPTEVVLELNDSVEPVAVAKDRPFKRVDGYLADLKYEPEKKSWPNRRVGAPLSINNDDYIIVAISKAEVVLSTKSNNKKTPISYNPVPDNR